MSEKSVTAHTCHWPGCETTVPPKMWGCSKHWFKLPKAIRDRIWAAYRPGQEIDKNPSAAYIAAAQSAQEWIAEEQEK
jgi:hypothetical protein